MEKILYRWEYQPAHCVIYNAMQSFSDGTELPEQNKFIETNGEYLFYTEENLNFESFIEKFKEDQKEILRKYQDLVDKAARNVSRIHIAAWIKVDGIMLTVPTVTLDQRTYQGGSTAPWKSFSK